jgi:hypothetical protein
MNRSVEPKYSERYPRQRQFVHCTSHTTCPGIEADENGLASRDRLDVGRERLLVMVLLLEVICHRLNFGQLSLVPHRAVQTTWHQLSAGAVNRSFIARCMRHLFIETFTRYSDYLRGRWSGDRIAVRGRIYFASPQRSDRLWGPSSLPLMGTAAGA